jgi:hypothetical protein
MRFGQAVLGVAHVLAPGLVALGFGEVRLRGERVRIIRLLWESGRQPAA